MSDRYQIQGKIGQGGLGAVYKAFDTQLKREVALKRVLTPEEADATRVREAAEKLMTEATVMSSLNHPNIVTVFDVGRDESGGFVVMELLDGETLDDTIARGLLTLDDFREVVNQTLEALIAAQAVNMLHRDLKPGNVMVIWRPSGKFQIKVLDFGLAKVSSQPSIQTIDHGDAILGSIYFMAPEQFERRKLDFRTDLYAMGCIYYNSLTGKYPFDGDTAPQVMASHLQHKVRPLQELRPDLPPDVCQWVMWLINRDMNKRPADAGDALARFPLTDANESVAVATVVGEPTMTADGRLKVKAGASRVATGSQSSRAATGSHRRPTTSSRVPTISGPVRAGGVGGGHSHVTAAQQLSREAEQRKKRLSVLIGLGVTALILIALAAVLIAGKFQRQEDEKRLAYLVGNPQGTGEDVNLLVSFLDTEEAQGFRSQAAGALQRLSGPGIDPAILESLQTMEGVQDGRALLLEVIEKRNQVEAFEDVLSIYQNSSVPAEKKAALKALSVITRDYDVQALLPLLNRNLAPQDRDDIESTIIRVLLADNDVANRVDPILNQIETAEGDARQSLARIVGTLGGPKALTWVEAAFADTTRPPYDALTALQNWPDRSVQKLLTDQLSAAKDITMKTVLGRALIRLLGLPSLQTTQFKDVPVWNLAGQNISSQNDWNKLLAVILNRPHPSTLTFLQQDFSGPDDLKKRSVELIQKKLENLTIAGDAFVLTGETVNMEGTAGPLYDPRSNTIEGFRLPSMALGWSFQVEQPGLYKVEIEMASDTTGSTYEIISGSTHLRNLKAENTGGWDEYQAVDAGKVQFDSAGPQLLYLSGGKVIKDDIMNIRSVKLTRIGDAPGPS